MADRRGRVWVSRWFAGLAFLAALVFTRPESNAQDFDVDMALVLAIDCSFSVDSNEFRLQMEGLGRAFQRAEVKKAIQAGNRQRIAVTAFFWSDATAQLVIVPWSVISGDADADELGNVLTHMPRKLAEGGTSISTALLYGDALFDSAPSAERRVIDVSSDGRNNVGPPVNMARDKVVANGVTINALVILNEWPTLDVYFDKQVVGGEGHFVIPANDYGAYSEAIYRKLLKEITGPGIS